MRSAGVWVAAIAIAVFGIGVAALLLTPAPYTRALSERFSLAGQAGLTRAQATALAEDVRAFVVGGSGSLPETVAGRPGFDADAVSHLADVGDVLSRARVASALVTLGVAVWIGVMLRRGERRRVGVALERAAAVSAGVVAVAALVALVDFDAFFSAFHQLFFAEGTWTFPYDSLLIRLFPEAFWAWSGVAWGALVLMFAACCWLVGLNLAREE